MSKSEGFCTHCGIEIASFAGLSGCPNCGTTSVPCSHKNQVSISINWHELAVLCIWAERWGDHCKGDKTGPGVVYAIADRIAKQHAGRAKKSPLTLAGQINQLRDNGHKVDTDFGPARE